MPSFYGGAANVRIKRRGFKSRITKVTPLRAARARKNLTMLASMSRQVKALSRTIETKEGTRKITNIQMPHNQLTVFTLNPFESTSGTGDPMVAGTMQRIGDSIHVQSITFKCFVEASLGRSKVYFRFMLLKCAKGDTPTRGTLFEESCDNKMIDTIHTERYTVVASKTFNVSAPNLTAATVGLTGLPATAGVAGITGNRVFTMRIPGRKFGRNGVVTYENQQGGQVKFFDYKLVCVAYDWYGTPQDVNNVGFINDGYTKIYFKDA